MFFFRFNQLDEPEKELIIPARDQVQLRTAKPKPADENIIEHVRIEEEHVKLSAIKQSPVIKPDPIIPHNEQVQLKQKFQPKKIENNDIFRIENNPLKFTPPVVKQLIFFRNLIFIKKN